MLLLLIFFIFQRLAVSVHHSNATDLAALLSFKSLVRDPDGLLDRSWNSNNTSFCTWFGVSCSPRRQRVIALQLEGLSLHGTISPHLGNLSFMNRLDLSNNSLRGPIPHSLGQLPRLASLALGYNQLSGHIPSAIFNMSSITYISFIKNNLSGPLLTDTVDNITIPRAQYLSVESNQLRGSIPSDFLLRCKDLQYLSLSTNLFRGSIPEELTRLQKLRVLYLNTNSLTGTIPTSIGNLTYLTKLDLSSNHLFGVIPLVLGGLMNLQWLTLGGNYLTGGIPTSLLNASMMGLMDLSDNNLTGIVQTEIGKSLPHLTFLGFGTNELSGRLEFITSLSHCKGLLRLHISYNEFEGAIPNSIGNLSGSLYEFDACGNRITGEIPATLGNLTGLLELCFDGNKLTGNIPPTIFNLEGLQVLDLRHNSLSGSIPDEIGRLNRLGQLGLDYNALSGAIPDSIGNVSALQFLWLDNNKLSSSIPDSVWSLSNLVGMYFFQNTLEGSIPPEVVNLVAINQLDLSANQLFGDIPDTFAQLQTLTTLNVSNNSFEGLIPESFSKLTDIQYLDLSLNEFSSPVPEFLADLRQLVILNLSFNKFEGKVPTGGIFSNISFQSLTVNKNLCGSQELGLKPCSKSRTNGVHKLKIILPTIAASLIILLSSLSILLAYRWRSKHAISSSETPHLNMYTLISYHELVRATDNFSESNLLGTGSYGSVYRGRLNEESHIAVKVLDLETEGSSRSFDSECSALRMIRHRNLIRIVSTCSNLDFKALVLEYMPNGSPERWLYSPGTSLNLLQRMKILLDVALALEYLHHHLQQAVVHCDIKPSNVLLDQDMNARVSDFGIAKLLSPNSKSIVSASAPGIIGYMPPEYGSTGRVSRREDVYSYRILLLETFTDVVDANLFGEESSDVRETPDVCQARHRCLSSVIELALDCSKDSPKERITMKEVVSRMQKIRT